MNKQYKDYLRRTRQTPAMRLTDAINRCATPENAARWASETDKLVLCSVLLAGQDVRSTLTTDEGERNCLRLENKLAKISAS